MEKHPFVEEEESFFSNFSEVVCGIALFGVVGPEQKWQMTFFPA